MLYLCIIFGTCSHWCKTIFSSDSVIESLELSNSRVSGISLVGLNYNIFWLISSYMGSVLIWNNLSLLYGGALSMFDFSLDGVYGHLYWFWCIIELLNIIKPTLVILQKRGHNICRIAGNAFLPLTSTWKKTSKVIKDIQTPSTKRGKNTLRHIKESKRVKSVLFLKVLIFGTAWTRHFICPLARQPVRRS